MTTLWQFYLYYGVIVGTGFTALGFIPHVALMARWFDRRRGVFPPRTMERIAHCSVRYLDRGAPHRPPYRGDHGQRPSPTAGTLAISVIPSRVDA